MTPLTMEMIERGLAKHQALKNRLFKPEIKLRTRGLRPPWKPPAKSAFEEFAENLGVPETRWRSSRNLRDWALANKERYYVPEELLSAWGMTVEVRL